MGLRGGTIGVCCTWPGGCGETGIYEVATAAERKQVNARAPSWRCVRHSRNGTDVVSAQNPRVVTKLIARRHPELKKNFWHTVEDDGAEVCGSGFMSGPGFKLFAEDVPDGTEVFIECTLQVKA